MLFRSLLSQAILLLLLVFPTYSDAQVQGSKLPVAEASQGNGRFYKADVDLGVVPAGTKSDLRFVLKNSTKATFNIPNIRSNCSCADVTINETKIAPGGTTEIAVTISAPRLAKEVEQRIGITLHAESGSAPVIVHCKYKLSGLLAFTRDSFIANFNINLKRDPDPLRIPFLVTPPIDTKNLVVNGLDGLSTAVCEVVNEEGVNYVVCKVPRKAIGDDGLAGRVQVRDTQTKSAATLSCLISAIGDYRIIPRHLSLSWNQEDKCYRANALFKYEGELSEEKSFTLDARLSGIPGRVLVEEKPIGTTGVVNRLSISVWPSDGKPFTDDVIPEHAEWFFKVGKQSYSTKSNLSFFPVTRFKEKKE